MSEKHWYQDGWVVFVIIAVLGFLTLSYRHNNKQAAFAASQVNPQYDWEIRKPLLGTPTLYCSVWHDRPETLQGVVLVVSVKTGDEDWDQQTHSLVTWSPNRDHQIEFEFPLPSTYLEKTVKLTIVVGGSSRKPSKVGLKFENGEWNADWSAMGMESPPPK
jgi:hypothetical protein